MSISGIGNTTSSFTASASKSKADETTEQLAAQGDPIAIAKLKQEEQEQDPATAKATEPGKGENVDHYI